MLAIHAPNIWWMRLLDRQPQRGLLRRWLLRSAIGGSLFALLLVGVTGGRDDWMLVTIGMAIVACCAVLIVRAVVRGDLSGRTMYDDW